MGQAHPRLEFPPLNGKQRIHVIGSTLSHHTGRARQIADLIASSYPESFETWYWFGSFGEYRDPPNGFLIAVKQRCGVEDGHPLFLHKTSPFVWIETAEGEKVPLGGRDRFVEWVHKQPQFQGDEERARRIRELATEPSYLDAWVNESPGTSQQQQPQQKQ